MPIVLEAFMGRGIAGEEQKRGVSLTICGLCWMLRELIHQMNMKQNVVSVGSQPVL
jgi:hypothetical protein